MVGYGKRLPDPKWPGQARLALQISLNYEAGGELNLLHGDTGSEGMLTDIGFPAVRGARSPLVESSFEYGSRRGVWRLLRLFEERRIKVGILAVATALARNREVAAAMVEAGHEIVSHHYRWIDYQHVPIAVERRHVQACGRDAHGSRRRPAARMDDRTAEPQHPAAARRGGRLPL